MSSIFLDMDGVIANFDNSYRSIFGVNCRDDPKRKNWNTFILEYNGFENLDIMDDGAELIEYLRNLKLPITILSCAGKLETYAEVSHQKTVWLKKRGLDDLPRIFTHTKLDKSKHATPTSILIDDSVQCIEPFIKAGGKGILHVNTIKTIEELEQII